MTHSCSVYFLLSFCRVAVAELRTQIRDQTHTHTKNAMYVMGPGLLTDAIAAPYCMAATQTKATRSKCSSNSFGIWLGSLLHLSSDEAAARIALGPLCGFAASARCSSVYAMWLRPGARCSGTCNSREQHNSHPFRLLRRLPACILHPTKQLYV